MSHPPSESHSSTPSVPAHEPGGKAVAHTTTKAPAKGATQDAASKPADKRGSCVKGIVQLTALALLVGALAIGVAAWLGSKAVEAPAKVIEQSGDAIAKFVTAIRSETIVTRFTSYATTVSGTQQLQIVSLTQHETVTKESIRRYWPDVVIEARYPVTYVYSVPLGPGWEFELDEKARVLRVVAPAIEPGEPAIEVSKLELKAIESSVLRSEDAVKQKLMGELTQITRQRAQANVPLVREVARRKVEQFVRDWLVNQLWEQADGKATRMPIERIDVIFEDERKAAGDGVP